MKLDGPIPFRPPSVDPPIRTGQALLIDGPLACGKTTKLRSFVEHAAQAGYLTATAVCSHPERNLPFGVLAQLVRSSRAWRDALAGLPGLPSVLGGTATPVGEAECVQLCHQLCATVIELSEHVPMAIAVDDVRHGDIPSLHFLLQLVRRLESARIVTMFTDNLSLPSSYLPLRYELLHYQNLRRFEVAPLSRDEVVKTVTEELGEEAADRSGTDFHQATGGNRLLLHTLLDDHREYGEARETGYGQTFLSCLHRNEPVLLDTARALAVLGFPLPAADLARMTGHSPEPIGQALTALTASGLTDQGAFRHEAARRSVRDDIPAQTRERLHQRAARLLHDRGSPATTVAYHLARAGRTSDPWSADMLLETAEQASMGQNIHLSVELLERLLESCSEDDKRAAVRTKLAEVEWKINPSAAARHHTPLYAATRSSRLSTRDNVALLKQLLWKGRMTEAEELLGRLRDDPEASDQLHDVDKWLICFHPGLARRGAASPPGGGSAETRAAVWPQAAAVLADVLTGGHSPDTDRRAEEALRELPLQYGATGQEEAALSAVFALIYGDRLDLASMWCDILLGDSTFQQFPTWQGMLSAARSEILLRRGDLTEAAELARSAFTHVSPNGWGTAVGLPLGSLILANTRMGRYEEAGRQVAKNIPNSAFTSRHGLHYLYARGHYLLAINRHQAALADFLLCGKLLTAWGLNGGTSPVPWRIGAAEAWLSQGNLDQARVLVYEQLGHSNADNGRARGQSLRLLAATSSAKRSPQLLNEAANLFEEQDDKYELACTLKDLSQAYLALGDKKRARRIARRAWHMAKMCNAIPLWEESLPAVDGARPAEPLAGPGTGIDQLTNSERRVSSLAAMGYTNREIAGKLYITASTVEQHLTRVFRKLNVKQRDQLPTELYAAQPKSA